MASQAWGEPEAEPRCVEPEAWHRTGETLVFQRKRWISGFTAPLKSTGTLEHAGDVIYWRTEEPTEMVLRIDEHGIAQSIGGESFEPMPTGDPFVATIEAVLEGNLDKLDQDFGMSKEQVEDEGPWTVMLRPRTRPLSGVVDTIELVGCARLQILRLIQPNGDRDELTFSVQSP